MVNKLRGTWKLAIMMLTVAGIAFAFYAPALRFGFFNDDPTGHFRWMESRTILSFFVNASGHGYYRPISFALWQILYELLGRHDPFVLHLLNILVHAANAALVCWLGYWLVARSIPNLQSLLYGCVAGLLFALYPFSYEAVPYVGSFVHPLVTLFILLALAFYLNWRARSGWGWFAAAHLAVALAVFTQENGIIAPLLILILEIGDWGLEIRDSQLINTQYAIRNTFHVSRSMSFFVEPLIFASAWLLVPKSNAVGRVFSLQAAQANILPFVQALVYPLAPLAQQNLTWLTLIAIAALVGLYLLARALRQMRLLVFGLLIWMLAALPSVLLLDNAYITGSPRLFYLGSVGAALIWALPIQITNYKLQITNCVLRLTFYVLLFALYLVPNTQYLIPYTACQLHYQGYAGEVGQMMADTTRQVDDGQSVTFVNLPYFFGSRGPGTECPQPFAFVPTGAVVIPPYADARDFVFYNGGADLSVRATIVNAYAPGWATHGQQIDSIGLRAALAKSRVLVFDLLGWQLRDLSAVWQINALHPDVGRAAPIAVLGDQILLQQVEVASFESGLAVTLVWCGAPGPGQDYVVFTQLLDGSGHLVAQHDAPPAGGLVPTHLWLTGDCVVDVHVIPVPGNGVSDEGRIIAGMYDPLTTTRLEAYSPSGKRLPDDAITVWP